MKTRPIMCLESSPVGKALRRLTRHSSPISLSRPSSSLLLKKWCREAFTEKEERLREFHQGPRSFDQAGGFDEHGDDDEASRSGLLALVFFVAFFLLVAFYGGKVFYAGAASACCLCTLVTSLGGFDTLELRWSRFSFGTSSAEELKQE